MCVASTVAPNYEAIVYRRNAVFVSRGVVFISPTVRQLGVAPNHARDVLKLSRR